MKSEFQKMRSGELYYYSDAEVLSSIEHAKRLCARMRQMTEFDDGFRPLLEELIPGIPGTAMVIPPFNCDHGTGIVLGEHVFINCNCTFLDSGKITIGEYTLIGPGCSFYTPSHPMDHEERREPKETGLPISIGRDCWLGGGVTVLPGVSIGDRCIIGAGSVVTHDIPDDSEAVGNPARVVRKL